MNLGIYYLRAYGDICVAVKSYVSWICLNTVLSGYLAYIKAVWWMPCWSFYQLTVLYQIIILFFLFKQVSVRTCYLSTEGKPCGSVLFACKSLQQCLFTVLVTRLNESCGSTKEHWICRPFQNTSSAHLKRLIYLSISQIQHVPNYHTTRRQALLSTLPVSWVFYPHFNYTVNTKGIHVKVANLLENIFFLPDRIIQSMHVWAGVWLSGGVLALACTRPWIHSLVQKRKEQK